MAYLPAGPVLSEDEYAQALLQQQVALFEHALATESEQDAQQALNQSRGYAQQLLAVAQGATAAFDAVYAQYRLAPEVTRKRMYLETMEDVLGKTDMTVIEPGSVQTYLPLSEVQRRAARSAAAAAPATEQAK